jgi:hypothetical protein
MASDTAKSAIERADELMKQGLQNVSITAPDGRRYRPDEFGTLMRKETRPDADRT